MNVAFVCVQNAGRSQMATAFAEQERRNRGVEDDIGIVTGGTQPASHVHDEVVTVMREVGIDLSEKTPREVTFEELQAVDMVITMGCSAEAVCPATWDGENRDWGLDDPDGQDLDVVREIRDEIRERVVTLFDELLAERDSRADEPTQD